jgi:hypothetical protein
MATPEDDPDDEPGPKYQVEIWGVLGLALLAFAALFAVRFEQQPNSSRNYPARPQIEDVASVMQTPPEIDDEYLPCRDCHRNPDRETGPIPRELEWEHEDTQIVHGNLWCLHCHDPAKPGKLRLADGKKVRFKDSWALCTQCHPKKLREWRAGVHGKQTGHWRGTKEYLTCVACHEPHAPAFGRIPAKPRPKRPDEIVYKEHDEGVENSGDL